MSKFPKTQQQFSQTPQVHVQCLKLGKNPGCPYDKCWTISGNRPFIFPKNWLPERNFSCLGQPGNH